MREVVAPRPRFLTFESDGIAWSNPSVVRDANSCYQ